jgi:hypothetical protein
MERGSNGRCDGRKCGIAVSSVVVPSGLKIGKFKLIQRGIT